MRWLGEISGRKSAERFVAHLLTQEISTHIETNVDQAEDLWEVWVRDEDKLKLALAELRAFQANPADSKYDAALQQAADILAEKEKKRQQAAKNLRKMDTSSPSAMGGVGGRGPTPPLTLTLMILCIALGLISQFGRPSANNDWGATVNSQLSFVRISDFLETENPAASILKGQVWRTITPIFLHGGMLHLAMNMMGLFYLGRIVERLMGTPRYGLFVLLLAVFPNLLQGLTPAALGGSPHFVGISGVVYGLLGHIWIRNSLNPRFGYQIPTPFMIIAVGMILLGLSGAVENWHLADLCHLGGLLVGLAVGYAIESSNTGKR